ncbi:MAG: hypothetical protein MJZ96_01680 [Paludibacteraceae bacterium]|nr:hypothetical protein [Paludibacteraceae bacterium]
MKEKELDNTYMSEVGDGQKRLSTDPVEVDNGLDSIIVSNVTQTLSGGMTLTAPEYFGDRENVVPAGTPIVKMSEGGMSAVIPYVPTSSQELNVIGIAMRSFVFSRKPVLVSIAKAAHVNVDALADALEKTNEYSSLDREMFKEAYIYGAWHKSLCLTFEQND